MPKAINKFYSPLRYPGGKTRLAPFIKELLCENKLIGIDYLEPYAGGAGVALSLLLEEYVNTITINDYDRGIYAFWCSIVHENERFCRRIKRVSVDLDTWEMQHEVQKNKKTSDLFNLGFSTFFLNRTNISGVIKGGVIGGKNQTGNYKINARFNKIDLIKRIRAIGKYRDRIKVTCNDALQIINREHDDTFFYIDPPYVEKSKYLYMNVYEEKDHRDISKALLSNRSKCVWLLSYDINDLVGNLYKHCKNNLTWKVGYGLSNRSSKENLFFHPKLKFEHSRKYLAA